MHIITHGDQQTKDLGKKIAVDLKSGDIICLYGELGAGKTTFVKGIAEGFGIAADITSPTFTLMNVYDVKEIREMIDEKINTLIHIDTYRLTNAQELLDIGVEDYLGQPQTITIIEWPEKIEELLKNKTVIKIHINHRAKDEREITID